MATKIQDLVLDILRDNPGWDNDRVAEEVQKRNPGASTSAASVASIKSKAKKSGALDTTALSTGVVDIELPTETEEERSDRIRRRYATLERMANRVAEGALPSIIVSGPPGLGKSYTVEQVLKEKGLVESDVYDREGLTDDDDDDGVGPSTTEGGGVGEYDTICGTITAVGLYISLWNMREGGIVVLDDCDDVFRDETCLNILKAVLDSSDNRRVSYRKKAHWMDEMGIPASFEFKGSVVFCTNIDFEAAIAKGSSMAPHFGALIDRCLYLSLTMRTTDDFITRIRHVSIEEKMLEKAGLTEEQAMEVFTFVDDNRDRFYGLSLRLLHQMAICFLADEENWKDDIEATKMRTF